MASVAPLRASVSSSSPSGMDDDFMAVRVRIMLWHSSGMVSSSFRAAAAAAKAGTPGVTS